jgi:hypothetical protein
VFQLRLFSPDAKNLTYDCYRFIMMIWKCMYCLIRHWYHKNDLNFRNLFVFFTVKTENKLLCEEEFLQRMQSNVMIFQFRRQFCKLNYVLKTVVATDFYFRGVDDQVTQSFKSFSRAH